MGDATTPCGACMSVPYPLRALWDLPRAFYAHLYQHNGTFSGTDVQFSGSCSSCVPAEDTYRPCWRLLGRIHLGFTCGFEHSSPSWCYKWPITAVIEPACQTTAQFMRQPNGFPQLVLAFGVPRGPRKAMSRASRDTCTLDLHAVFCIPAL